MGKRMRSLLLKVSILAALLLTAPAAMAADPPPNSPSATVERLNAALLEVMQQADELGYAGRYAKLEPTLTEIFDFQGMARVSLGSHWSKLSDAQEAAFTQAFADYSVGVFAHRFDGFSGERFEVLGEQEGRRGTVLVRNQIVKSDGEAVEINYLTQPQDDGSWRIIDTILGGTASELAARRSEYSSIMRKLGIDALIQALKDKTAGFADD